jgi:hypothetical protein
VLIVRRGFQLYELLRSGQIVLRRIDGPNDFAEVQNTIEGSIRRQLEDYLLPAYSLACRPDSFSARPTLLSALWAETWERSNFAFDKRLVPKHSTNG